MSDTKKTKKTTKAGSSAKKSSTKTKKAAAVKKPVVKKEQPVEAVDRTLHQLMPFLLGVVAIFLLICFFAQELTGIVGWALRNLFWGLFGGAAFALPILLGVLAVFWRKELRRGGLVFLMIYQAAFFLFLSAMIHIWAKGDVSAFSLPTYWKNGVGRIGGGAIGGMLGFALYQLTGPIGANIIGIAAMVVFGLFMFGLTPYSIYVYIAYYFHERKERIADEAPMDEAPVERKHYRFRAREEEPTPARVKRDPVDRHRFEPDVEVGEGYAEEGEEAEKTTSDALPKEEAVPAQTADPYEGMDEDDIPPFDVDGAVERVRSVDKKKVTRRPESVLPKSGTSDDEAAEKADLHSIFTDPDGVDVLQRFAEEQKQKELERQRLNGIEPGQDAEAELSVSRAPAVEDGAPASPEVVKKIYEYPPISLLRFDNTPKNVDISEELHSNATKLVETLRSFKVRTRIVNVSRGPAITRYELAPEEGVRVRAIANLVDDIALNLATTGVRIEAPIPGKAAVGIEVPNKSVSTVYLRELVDTETFRKAQSKLNVSLGVDVAGDPVYLDIAKMPHLLIAGATGMGKSVCINSVITSLLYKASPEEVKLILIDPKKVELNIYNGLPHLLVPVVSEPKKAAGSLQWAVTEMERRFELIEEVGVRDLKMYNTVTKDDPQKEFLPQIVIIIDELADLMMTAPDDVEDSICRLAQKARAAGMHLIIGTQRPSVDVITGLIKANVPSRIAFTVASQTDSRVVLDMSGAEKLIGRGDMLYAPVGASKPRRVQGAFVSETEVENIVTFIKEHNGDTVEYSSDIMDSIERAAAACGGGKKGGSGGSASDDGEFDDGGDSMLRPAIELALETGKISTSLIQRRLSLGYGRAAKLIDEMEKRGIVSAPEGQKPRTVLITKQQYMEMVLNRSEEL